MQIGIGLPASIPGTPAAVILDWGRRADAGPFSSLGIIDRLVYPNYEPLITLAAVAGATRRIRLTTSVLLAPLRRPGMLAKQAATLDALSGGRLTLGLGIGGREDDFRAAPAEMRGRGRRFEDQLALMKRVWSGEPAVAGDGPLGPAPARAGGPEILLGGYSPAAMARVGRFADGLITGGIDPAGAGQFYGMAQESWQAAGRPGKPRFVACTYFGLGPRAAQGIRAYLGDYYRFMGPAVEGMIGAVPAGDEAVKGRIAAFAAAGADELILWPCVPELEQVDRLAALIK
jgi:alkanesulfonate monooxygenase SsuD/methylene tetrahydromethanopterin reductase-like flavin-dependent oxidoreductase (luciferase family)